MAIHTIIGVDPGQRGGIAKITKDGISVWPMDDQTVLELAHDLAEDPGVLAVVEKTHAMPKQGVVSQWTFGVEHGWLLGIFAALGIQTCLVTPQSWKRWHGLIGTDKAASIARAHELYPGVNLRRSKRCRTDSDGIAEALLIADYGWITLAGGTRPALISDTEEG